MLEESGKIVRIDRDALWVETIQQTACGHCAGRKGCGQHVLGEAMATSSTIRVLLQGLPAESFKVDQQVTIGIPEDVIVKGSLLVYFIPLLLLVIGGSIGGALSETAALLGAVVGLCTGGALVRWHAWKNRNNPRLQPVLLSGGSLNPL